MPDNGVYYVEENNRERRSFVPEAFAIYLGTVLFIFGATVGSFLNVVIARLPQGLSIVRPRSRCPICLKQIRWYDNVPIVSFMVLRGRCRDCGAPISWRYPLIEALTGLMAVLLWLRFGLSLELTVHVVFTAALIVVTFVDLDHGIIPNEISLPGIVLGFACSFLFAGKWIDSLIGLLVGGGVLLAVSLLYAAIRGKEGMGMGDVKLLAMLGAWLGWKSLLFIAFFASLQGIAVAVVLWIVGVKLKPPEPEESESDAAARGEKMADTTVAADPQPTFFGAAIPFGPFLSIAGIEYLFLAPWFDRLLFSLS
jgi:leader peptidase (prepilin peptidase)/N-methyltransferase